jgi:predicted dehydrogenase
VFWLPESQSTNTPIQNYAGYALDNPEKCKVVAIADPRPKTREIFTRNHKLDRTLVFKTWQDLLKASAETIQTIGKRLVDAVIVAVQDHMHCEVVQAFAAQGYHILCEKPMATSLRDCLDMEKAVKNAGIIFGMGHGQ